MPLRSLFVVLVIVALAIFAAVNWTAFVQPTTLSLVLTSVQAPLGLIMLVITGLLGGLFLAYVVYLQSTVILEARRSARELAAQRELADQAEASRFTELRNFVGERLQKIEADFEQARTLTQSGLDRMQDSLRSAIEQSGNTVAAYIGEVEDRLERRLGNSR